MSRLFVDCEFNGFGGQLMSMALVHENADAWWYEVLPLPEQIDPWVAENVVPVLYSEPVSPEAFRASLIAFLAPLNCPTICADWYTDIVHFMSCFAGKDHTESFAFPCKTELRLINDYHSVIPHNALADARAIKAAWNTGYSR